MLNQEENLQDKLEMDTKPIETNNAEKFMVILQQDLLKLKTVKEIIEIALQLDKSMYSHLPIEWRNPGIAGLCALRLVRDALQKHQCAPEIKEFLAKIDRVSEKTLEILQQDGKQSFIKPLINKIYEYVGGFEKDYYSAESFSKIKQSLSDVSKSGQLVYRPQDGRFFLLVDNQYIYKYSEGTIEDIPKAAIEHAHITINDRMSLADSKQCFAKANEKWGESIEPIYKSRQQLKYLNKIIQFEVVGAYIGFPKTNSRLLETHQLFIESQELQQLAIEGFGPKLTNYTYHITFRECIRQEYAHLTLVKKITELLYDSPLSKQLCTILNDSSLKNGDSVTNSSDEEEQIKQESLAMLPLIEQAQKMSIESINTNQERLAKTVIEGLEIKRICLKENNIDNLQHDSKNILSS